MAKAKTPKTPKAEELSKPLIDIVRDQGHVIKVRGGKEYVLFTGLLLGLLRNNDHEKIQSIKTDPLEFSYKDGYAFFRCTITTESGKQYVGHGDATQKNCSAGIKTAFFRMAETRAICRASRLALGKDLAMTAFEELAEEREQTDGLSKRTLEELAQKNVGLLKEINNHNAYRKKAEDNNAALQLIAAAYPRWGCSFNQLVEFSRDVVKIKGDITMWSSSVVTKLIESLDKNTNGIFDALEQHMGKPTEQEALDYVLSDEEKARQMMGSHKPVTKSDNYDEVPF
tara:strand:- start:3401 stop:4252 length:852 start_codon:yes stop_codon:yes gene_type:complete